jgi:deazaflavin-dependent oxidoreductase (nitroreductase family)
MAESNLNDWNRQIIEEFRTNGGKVGGAFEGVTLLLLTTTGAKSGQQRINPLTYLLDGERLFIFASKGGSPTNPDWYHNLVVVSTVAQICRQTWTQAVFTAPFPFSRAAILPHSTRLEKRVMTARAWCLNRAPVSSVRAPPLSACSLVCERAWAGSSRVLSPAIFPSDL